RGSKVFKLSKRSSLRVEGLKRRTSRPHSQAAAPGGCRPPPTVPPLPTQGGGAGAGRGEAGRCGHGHHIVLTLSRTTSNMIKLRSDARTGVRDGRDRMRVRSSRDDQGSKIIQTKITWGVTP